MPELPGSALVWIVEHDLRKAHAFAYGGSRGRTLYDPEQAPREFANKVEYRASASPTINHFYEKLLLLRERMNTPFARRLAEHRHQVMEAYLAEFYAEWSGEQ